MMLKFIVIAALVGVATCWFRDHDYDFDDYDYDYDYHTPEPKDPCSQPRLKGMCRARFRRYFFNKGSGRCERFYYGGCGKNENNFITKAACLRKCGGKGGRPDKCKRIRCGWPKCRNGARPVTKPGHCCPSCPPQGGRPDKCKRIRCGWPKCRNGARPVTKPGHCCPSCPSKPKCSRVMCRMLCPAGFKKDSNGCPICRCYNPCENHKCPRGQKCELERMMCIRSPCPARPVCKKPKCSPYMCAMYCRTGFQTNANGCPICKCNPDPCSKKKCPTGQTCELQQPRCIRAPCPPFAVCKKPQHPDCKLPMKVGRCRAAMPRFYYDTATKRCRGFTYGGCGGNKNNFSSMAACKAKCS